MHAATEAMDVDEVPENIANSFNSFRKRPRSVNRIRNLNAHLATRDHKNATQRMQIKKKKRTVWYFLKLLLIPVCFGVLVVYLNITINLGQHLKNNYYMAYERLSQLSNELCAKRQANFTPILESIDDNIIGQQHLHGELEAWFQTIGNSPFSCALFVGATGVGKSFTANIIAKHYPHPMNVLYMSTNGKTRYTAFKIAVFKILHEALLHGKCIYYMIVFDYLSDEDIPFVAKISDRLRAVSYSHHLMLQALFVFKGTAHHLQKETITDTIPEARIITFAHLGRNELEGCIRREAVRIGIDLSNRDFIVKLVANQINVTRHGCKPVRAKLSLYSVS